MFSFCFISLFSVFLMLVPGGNLFAFFFFFSSSKNKKKWEPSHDVQTNSGGGPYLKGVAGVAVFVAVEPKLY